jgi:hypothetical protein
MIWRRKTTAPAARAPTATGKAQAAGVLAEFVAQGLAAVGSGAGAAIALATGKLLLAGLLAMITCSIAVRLLLRRRRADQQRPPRPALWMQAASGLGAALLCAALVEAVKLPVRYDQPGFERSNWLIVLAALVLLYATLLGLLRRLAVRRHGAESA